MNIRGCADNSTDVRNFMDIQADIQVDIQVHVRTDSSTRGSRETLQQFLGMDMDSVRAEAGFRRDNRSSLKDCDMC